MNILPEVVKEKDYLVSVRRHLHKNPELSLKEFSTATYIEEQLESMGINYRRVGETGILGTITGKNGNGKTVLLRADIDALPVHEETSTSYQSHNAGIMHACGHDVHTASLLGAAKVLQSLRDTFAGQVLLVFQQAEEFGHGSKYFIEENITESVDRALGLHVAPDFPVGTIAMVKGADAASCDYFKITIQGKDAHISKPNKGIDALYIASLIACELKTLTERLVDPSETALIGVGKIISGSSYNIIAGSAVLEGTIRTFSSETQNLLQLKLAEVASHIASYHGGIAITEIETFTSALINDDTAFDEVYGVAEKIVGEDNIVTDPALITGLGSDDFAEYIQDTKGVYVHIGTSNNDPSTKHPLHSSKFNIDEMALLIAASLHVKYILSILGYSDYVI